MSTIVFQSTKQLAAAESEFMEPLTLRLRLTSPSISQPSDQSSMKPTAEFAESCEKTGSPEQGVWDFLKTQERCPLFGDSPVSSCPPSPSSYSCFSSLQSEKSLELCTENVGNETGCTEISEANLFSSVPSPVSSDQYRNSPKRFRANKVAGLRSFPPPLTTIRGGETIHFLSHRQDGRLIIEAVRAPPAYRSLLAERSHGRLRLCFLEEAASPSDSEPLDCQERSREEEVEADYLCEEGEEEEAEMEEEQEVDADGSEGDVDEKNEKFGVRMGNMEMFARAGRRCTEGGESEGKSRLLDWGPLWVATS